MNIQAITNSFNSLSNDLPEQVVKLEKEFNEIIKEKSIQDYESLIELLNSTIHDIKVVQDISDFNGASHKILVEINTVNRVYLVFEFYDQYMIDRHFYPGNKDTLSIKLAKDVLSKQNILAVDHITGKVETLAVNLLGDVFKKDGNKYVLFKNVFEHEHSNT